MGLVKRFPRRTGWLPLLGPQREKVALDGVDLRVRPGEVFGLLGPNGAGKTTLLKVLATILSPTSGRALVDGLDTVERSLEVRRRVGLVYGDERSFFWRLSVYENLRFYAALYRLPAQEAHRRTGQLLELVGLSSLAQVRLDRLSSGMKQRLAIARGLLHEPQILLMDEPTRNLDPLAAGDLRQLIRQRVAEEGQRTVVVATNVMAEAEQLCDRMALLDQGRIRLTGAIVELRRAVEAEERHLLVVSTIARQELEGLAAIPAIRSLRVSSLGDGAYEVELGVAQGSLAVPQAIRQIVAGGGDVWSSRPRELSLEELFRQVIGEDGVATAAGEGRREP